MGHISLRRVSFRYAHRGDFSLEDVSLEVDQGECVLLAGRSGSGKSTLLHVLSGLIPAYYRGELEGEVRIGKSKDWAGLSLWQKAEVVGVVFQDPRHQFFSARVEEELGLSLRSGGPQKGEEETRLREVLDRFGLLSLRHRLLDTLSSGEQQRVAIGSAMLRSPEVIAMDEPSANLSGHDLPALADSIRKAKEAGVTVVIAEHRFAWLRGVLDRVVVLEQGQVVFDGGLDRLEDKGFCKRHGLRPLAGGERAEGGPVPDCSRVVRPEAVFIEGLGYRYGKEWVLRGLSGRFCRGEITAITGKNGCGKTTLLKLVFGILRPKEGSISFPCGNRPKALALQHPDLQLFASTVSEEIGQGAKERERWLRRFALWHLRDRHPLTLSGGEMQRLVLAAAFSKVGEVPGAVLLLDEPTSGMDGEQLENLCKEIDRARTNGHCVLMATHDPDLAGQSGARLLTLGGSSFFDQRFGLPKK